MSDKKNLVVYGSLRNGFGNNRLLRNSEHLSTETISIPYRMISLGGFPGLIPSEENHDIVVEAWSVDKDTYRNVEYLEGWPSFYQKAVVKTSAGEGEVYVLESKRYQSGYPSVESGDWSEYYKRRFYEETV